VLLLPKVSRSPLPRKEFIIRFAKRSSKYNSQSGSYGFALGKGDILNYSIIQNVPFPPPDARHP